ncbi:MAG: hypothetical protein ACK5NC_05345 [Vibrio sp.]
MSLTNHQAFSLTEQMIMFSRAVNTHMETIKEAARYHQPTKLAELTNELDQLMASFGTVFNALFKAYTGNHDAKVKAIFKQYKPNPRGLSCLHDIATEYQHKVGLVLIGMFDHFDEAVKPFLYSLEA